MKKLLIATLLSTTLISANTQVQASYINDFNDDLQMTHTSNIYSASPAEHNVSLEDENSQGVYQYVKTQFGNVTQGISDGLSDIAATTVLGSIYVGFKTVGVKTTVNGVITVLVAIAKVNDKLKSWSS